MKISFKDIAKRLTGFSTPIFGVSWTPPKLEREKARAVLSFLEDRRALYGPTNQLSLYISPWGDWGHPQPDRVIKSVLEIRKRLTVEIEDLNRSSSLAGILSQMRRACPKFLDATEPVIYQFKHEPFSLDRRRVYELDPIFYLPLGEMRSEFGRFISELCVQYGLDVEEELTTILPSNEDEL